MILEVFTDTELMKQASSVKIFLANGTPDGLKIVEKSNWTGRAAVCSRAQFPDVKSREEFSKPGVYILLGQNEESEIPAIYIGEGDPVLPRLESHNRQKDFWTQLILFTSKDSNLNKAHIQYLESRLVTQAFSAKRYDVINGNSPLLPALSESDVAEMDHFLSEMLVIYSILGVSAFDLPNLKQSTPSENDTFILKIDTTAMARGLERAEGFIVLAGSKAKSSEAPSCGELTKKFRAMLLEKGVLKKDGDFLTLAQDYAFSSPSQASSTLLGRSSNGRVEWKTLNGISLKEIQEGGTK